MPMPRHTLVTPPTAEPIDLDEVKLALAIDGDHQNLTVWRWLRAARQFLENQYNFAFLTQTWDVWLDAWPVSQGEDFDVIRLPRPPLQSVTSVVHFDPDNTETTWSSTEYQVDTTSWPGRLVVAANYTWPASDLRRANAIRIRQVCGYTSVDLVPEDARQAVQLLVRHWQDNGRITETGHLLSEVGYSLDALMRNYRAWI